MISQLGNSWGQDEPPLVRDEDSPDSLGRELSFRGLQIPASLWGTADSHLGSDQRVAVKPGQRVLFFSVAIHQAVTEHLLSEEPSV